MLSLPSSLRIVTDKFLSLNNSADEFRPGLYLVLRVILSGQLESGRTGLRTVVKFQPNTIGIWLEYRCIE